MCGKARHQYAILKYEVLHSIYRYNIILMFVFSYYLISHFSCSPFLDSQFLSGVLCYQHFVC